MTQNKDLVPNREIKPFPTFSRPHICGVFSVDAERGYHDEMHNLNYLKIPKNVNFNLNFGDESYVEKPMSADEEKLKHLLTFIMKNCDTTIRNGRVDAEFVCFRGLLKQIMCTPYEYRESWIVMATKFLGTIYLCAMETEQKRFKKMSETERDRKFQRYGHKFENYIFSGHPNEEPPGVKKPVVKAEEFCIMFKSKIANNKILYGAEIDGVQSNEEVKSLEHLRRVPLIEAKVKRRENNQRQLQNFYKFKARNFWCQSFLVGIDHIIVGLRDDDGVVDEVTSVRLKDLSDEARTNNYWHGTVCVNFLNDFLEKVKKDMQHVDENDPKTIFQYEWDHSKTHSITTKQMNDVKFSILTPEFVKFMKKNW